MCENVCVCMDIYVTAINDKTGNTFEKEQERVYGLALREEVEGGM